MRYSRPYRWEIPLSDSSLRILDVYGEGYLGRWSLVEAAVLHSSRIGNRVTGDYPASGLRPQFRTELNLRSPTLGFTPEQLSRKAFPQTVGSLLHSELLRFDLRATRAVRAPTRAQPTTQVTVTLPTAAVRELKVLAFASGKTLYEEVADRFVACARRQAALFGDDSGPVREVPVDIPRDVYDMLRGHAAAIGSRPVAVAAQRMIEELQAGATA